jgi:RNA-splicing ligase RtcB
MIKTPMEEENKKSFRIQGKYADAEFKLDKQLLGTDCLDQGTIDQVQTICDTPIFKNSKIVIMPDTHQGKGSVIGFSCRMKDYVVPNIVGVDISCSISTYKIDAKQVDFDKLDKVIRRHIPSGKNIREDNKSRSVSKDFQDKIWQTLTEINKTEKPHRHYESIGTLGGGNHFLELNQDKDGNYWFSIHCGSRNFGKLICEKHQNKAIARMKQRSKTNLSSIPPQERQAFLESLKENREGEDLAYLESEDKDLYLKHMQIAREFAALNHKVILEEVCKYMKWEVVDSIFTNHNYIELLDDDYFMIRKGAISAYQGQRVMIPLNMRDGSIIGVGKGNEDWNYTAPHGGGRILSRKKAKEVLKMDDFTNSMQGIWTSCISKDTLDESPMAYKPMEIIMDAIEETVDIQQVIKPVYNFKASE